jgi:hypothetical protein
MFALLKDEGTTPVRTTAVILAEDHAGRRRPARPGGGTRPGPRGRPGRAEGAS